MLVSSTQSYLDNHYLDSNTASEKATVLQLSQISRKFGNQFVLRGVNLELSAGEILALFGDNGAGKSTLLRIIAGLLGPTRGEGRVFGYDLNDRRSVREHVFLLGEGGLYADLSVHENLEFSARMYGLRPTHSSLLTVLEQVGLADAKNKRARELSSGMKRRLQLARMLLAPLPLLLLDEPFANLDSKGKDEMLGHLQNCQNAGRSIIFTSHEPELARQIASREQTLIRGILQ